MGELKLKKAYKDLRFIDSPAARPIRLLAEFLEPENRLRYHEIENTIVFFGSARIVSRAEAEAELVAVAARPNASQEDRQKAERQVSMSRYYEDARELATRLTHWSMREMGDSGKRFYICSGGGPGIMEAANRGASEAHGASVGLNISLPMEQDPNPYQTRELAFDFHYFFMRKFWFFYLAKAMAVFPGGFGTFDELFELLTLVQTQKTKKPMPIVLYGKEFWHEAVNFEALANWGMISVNDLVLFHVCDSVEEAFDYLTAHIRRYYIDEDNGDAK